MADDNKVVVDSGDRANGIIGNLSKNKKSKKSTHVPNIGAIAERNFLTLNAKKAFNYLWLAFIKAPILQHFNLKSHIQIQTNASSYIIGRVLSQLNLNSDVLLNNSNKSDFNQWHPVAYFSSKIISVETKYKTDNAELLAIVKVFKIWCYYLESCIHKVFVLINHNNL